MMHAEQKQKKRFVLTMRNQKGQVGIFVALIFQVIFVFFAMLVNVGLVVHHKINLQQSTDLAAYYGAMKQAELMNVMAHVNFQIRQAWKLMAWRYRVLGTFGLEQNRSGTASSDAQIQFPVQWNLIPGPTPLPKYNTDSRDFSCPSSLSNAAGLSITDVPFMCMGHNGFSDWISASGTTQTETFCKITCNTINSMTGYSITRIPGVGTSTIFGNDQGAPINAAITRANDIVNTTCNSMGPITIQMLGLYYGNYIKDVQNKRAFIYMLAKNLGLPEDKMLDIEGQPVYDGVKNTLKNNLTEANLTSMTDVSIAALNGVKNFGGGTSWAEGMMRDITFQRLMFYMVDCIGNAVNTANISVKSIYDNAGNLNADLKTNLLKFLGNDPVQVSAVENLFKLNDERSNTVGFEKNPWIQVYYGVKATSEPKIPFLPLAKIKLHAVSFAKPFGGSMGPRYFKNWDSGVDDNSGRTDWGNRTDVNLPVRNLDLLPTNPTLKDVREFLPNYSTHIGDNFAHGPGNGAAGNKGGLANTDIVALYHNMLANKYGVGSSPSSGNKVRENNMGKFHKPENWPTYKHWFHLNDDVTSPNFDPLAVDRTPGFASNPKNTYMRDIELSVVAPNQFDVTYYSIEPDFNSVYANKFLNPQNGTIAKMATATGVATPPVMPEDFGHHRSVNIPGIPLNFSVRNQLEITHELFKKVALNISSLNGNSNPAMLFGLDVIASRQSSLLTGWTFLNLTSTGYSSFPGPNATGPYTMLFGTCDPDTNMNPWTEDFKAPADIDSNLPPVPGNCVTGGRTGYSVKIISSDLLRSGRTFENLGGPGMNGPIKNPVPDSFLQF